jgi:hypothetical protein
LERGVTRFEERYVASVLNHAPEDPNLDKVVLMLTTMPIEISESSASIDQYFLIIAD